MAERDSYSAPPDVNRIGNIALAIGIIGIVAWIAAWTMQPEQALRSWLLGFIFWAGIAIGSIGVLMLQYLTGGAWGVVIRRIAEAASRTLPLILILFLPLAAGITRLYEWTHLPADDHVMQHRGWFMTPESWWLRSTLYFAIFFVMMYLLNKWSSAQDAAKGYDESAKWLTRASRFSGPTMVIFALTVTFAAVDWMMMLDPHWFSTIWGLLFVAGWALSFFCFAVMVMAFLSDKAPMNRVLGRRHFHDIGKLMLALVMVWAYFNFSQFLIIWSGNLPEETGWYLVRMKGAWGWVGGALILFHFAFPFLVLLQQDFKRKAKLLSILAAFILFMRLVDMYYLIGPSPRIDSGGLEPGSFAFSWVDIAAPIGIGGIWLWYFFWQLKKRPLVPTMDPFFENAIKHGQSH
ncbi:MAG TPA: hypothetical protein DEA22_10725 [Blastocatellia bacterium]|nr:hypothetical protein [Blastocatellia bacterium]